MNTEELIRHIGKYRIPVIIICLLTFVFAFIYQYSFQYCTEEAKVRFLITKSELFVPNTGLNDDNISNGDLSKEELQRIKSFAFSKELMDYVIDTFHLIDRYKIDKKDYVWKEQAYQAFTKNYTFEINELNEIIVGIKDRDGGFALDMAKGIMNRINGLNNNYLISIVKAQYKVCEKQLHYLRGQKVVLLDSLNRFKSTLKNSNIPVGYFLGFYNKEYNTFGNNEKVELTELIKGRNQVENFSNTDMKISRYEDTKFRIETSLELLKEKAPIVLRETLPLHETLSSVIPAILEALKITAVVLLSVLMLFIAKFSMNKYVKLFFHLR